MTFHAQTTESGTLLHLERNGSWLRISEQPIAEPRHVALLILGRVLGASRAVALCDAFSADCLDSLMARGAWEIDSQTIEQWLIERSVAA